MITTVYIIHSIVNDFLHALLLDAMYMSAPPLHPPPPPPFSILVFVFVLIIYDILFYVRVDCNWIADIVCTMWIKPCVLTSCHKCYSLTLLIWRYPRRGWEEEWTSGGGRKIQHPGVQGRQTRQNSGGVADLTKEGLQNFFDFYAIKISTF